MRAFTDFEAAAQYVSEQERVLLSEGYGKTHTRVADSAPAAPEAAPVFRRRRTQRSAAHAAALSPAVAAALSRLAVERAPVDSREPLEIEGHEVPAAIEQLLFRLKWPDRTYHVLDEDGEEEVWGLRFGIVGWVDPRETRIRDAEGRPLVRVAEADGGNDLLVVALDDPNPADPQVYLIDHDDPDQALEASGPLSAFLSSLEPEQGAG
jgi:hypothetical protein